MLLSLSSLLLIVYVYSEPLASFTGPSYISFSLPNETQNNKFDLSYKTPFSYGLILAAFDASLNIPFRIYLDSGALTLAYNYGDEEKTVTLYTNHQPNTWNNITLWRQSKLVTIFVNTNQSQIILSKLYDNIILKKVLVGGLSDSLFSYHQFSGIMRTIILDEHTPLLRSAAEDTVFKNVVIYKDVYSEPQLDLSNQTATIGNSEISFPIAYTSFSNFSMSFEFKSLDNTILFLTFQMRQFFFSLRKDFNQLILELNLHGEIDRLVVELMSVTAWISVKIQVTDNLTLLSAGDRNTELKSRTAIAKRAFDKRPIMFGWSDDEKLGFRGCLRGVMVQDRMVDLYAVVMPHTDTLVGCWYPTPSCDTLSCPYPCTQTWEETKCVSVAETPDIAEFTGFGIIQISVPSLLTESEDSMSINLQFVSTSSNDDHVLLSIQHAEGDKTDLVTLQMYEGYIMLYFSLSDAVILNTDLPLNDGDMHTVSIRVSPTEISFQVDARIKRQAYNVDMSLFSGPTSIKIGGSSLKINSYGFSGCLKDIMINELDLLQMTTATMDNVVMQDVLLGQCSLVVAHNTTTLSSHATTPTVGRDSTTPTRPSISYRANTATDEPDSQRARTPSGHNESVVKDFERPGGGMTHDEQLLIGLMLGVITVIAVFVFLAYLLWQKRQMQRAAKERSRGTEEYDEEFLNKTYNPRKQDKYTLFTPHALDAIEEESEGDERVSLVNISV